ncbi:signal peptidase I [Acidipila sp. EB88]|uniref:signal peptidase I n=1 Tax=Acidipila sp. EB88 TaxID=2305226 RepID=UPI000F5D90EB|nr:signal peptidase I [Acidipila sp. EB88]RRA48593.1 signal peptidase I [Acidipila sp. EB88]
MATTVEEQQQTPPTSVHTEETTLEFIASICGVLVFGLFVLTFVFQNFVIPSGSMLKTLLIGDHVLVDRVTLAPRAAYAPFVHYRNVQRGDIVVFWKPGEPDLFLVKRVVGIPGDHLHLRNGVVYLNGKAQKEPQTQKTNDQIYSPYRDDFPAIAPPDGYGITASWSAELPTHIQGEDLVVPADDYFCMGDNRPNSLDSRYWGFVPRANILGRPLFVYWSFMTDESQGDKTGAGDQVAWLEHIVLHFFDQTRWSRTFHRVQ